MNSASGGSGPGEGPGRLVMSRRIWLEVLAEVWRTAPVEACGLLIGASPTDPVSRFVPIPNATEATDRYELEPSAYLEAVLAADDEGLEVVGVMHSHPAGRPVPSTIDVADAGHPLIPDDWHWLIVSLISGWPESRCYRIAGDRVDEIVIETRS